MSGAKRIIVGISGASGAMIGERLVRHLLSGGHTVDAILSDGGAAVFREELGIDLGKGQAELEKRFLKHYGGSKRLHVWAAGDFAARPSSGSAPADAMVIAPCSMSTVGAVANGITMNLVHRAASVALKERRPFVIVPRESPLSPVHLKNLLYLAEIGVHVVPATTAFYHRPKTVEEMVDFTIGRVFDLLKIENELFTRWRTGAAEE